MICPNWQYLITLDSDLKEASKYVDIRSENFDTFQSNLSAFYLLLDLKLML